MRTGFFRTAHLALMCTTLLSFSCYTTPNTPVVPPKRAEFRLPQDALVITNQANKTVVIADNRYDKVVWSWSPTIGEIPGEHHNWFHNPSEVKMVYDNKCILMTASGGAVALIRISDFKTLYYAYAGKNTHSADLLPDGNIVTASSTDGVLRTFYTDTIAGTGTFAHEYKLPAAHNVYWDAKRSKLFTLTDHMTTFDYNGNRKDPALVNRREKKIDTQGRKVESGHDLYPVHGEEDKLWMTTNEHVWKYDINTNKAEVVSDFYAVKSVSNIGKEVVMLRPDTEWWADHLIDADGKVVFRIPGFKIYKARRILH